MGTNQRQECTPYIDSTATINQHTTGSGTQHKNRPCPFVSWNRDHKVKSSHNNGPTIRPRKSTNTQAYNEWITTNTSHKHNRRRDGRRAKSKQRRNGNKKKQPM